MSNEDPRARLKRWIETGQAKLHPLTLPQRELWETSPVPPGDPAVLAGAWHEMLADPAELARCRENARRAARDFYSVEAMRERFLAGLRRAAGRQDPRHAAASLHL